MKSQTHHFCEFGPFRMDLDERVLLCEGRPVPLTPKAFDCLFVLVENNGHIVEKDELMQKVWPDSFVEEVNLARQVSTLRKVLEDNSDDRKYIETVAKRGYRFVAGVKEVQSCGVELVVEEHTKSDILIEELANGELGDASRIGIAKNAGSQLRFRSRFKLITTLVILALTAGVGGWLISSAPTSKSSLRPLKIMPLTSFPGSESQASFSPDGDRIAFVWDGEQGDNSDIYVKLIDTGTALRLTSNTAADINPIWSADGRYIAFLRRSGERCAIYLIPSLGGAERRLGEASIVNYGSSLDWSPDGKVLAIVDRMTPQERYRIFLLSIESGEKQVLTLPPAEFNGDSNPAFSPDGRNLAFIRIGSMGVSEVYLVPAVGGEPKRLTFENSTIIGLAWTPNASEIVFRLNRAGYTTLWRMPASGGTPEQIPSIGDEAVEPAISRRGNLMAYTRRVVDPNIWRIAVPEPIGRGSSPLRLISSTRGDLAPQFSPDGKRIVFVSDRSGSTEVWICDDQGLKPEQLTFFGGTHTGSPRWSPDNQHIAFDSRPEGHADVYVISADGSKPHRLTLDPSDDVVPSWSRDGRWIYFGSNRSGNWQVWKIASEGGAPIQVTKNGGFAAFESSDGRFIYYAKNRDVPGPLWRVPNKGGDEIPVPGFTKAAPAGQWAVLKQGVFFVNAEAVSRPSIEFFSFTTEQVTQVAALDKKVFGGPSFSVSSDGRWILYVQVDRNDSDLMLVNNFR